jgi:hypothetical protein
MWAKLGLSTVAAGAGSYVGNGTENVLEDQGFNENAGQAIALGMLLGFAGQAIAEGASQLSSPAASKLSLAELQETFDELAETALLPKYKALDPSLKAGYTGSFKTGVVGNPTKETFGKPIDLSNFDIDYWIESNVLSKKFGPNLKADVEFQKIVSDTPGFGGLKPNKQGFSIKFKAPPIE